MYANEDTINVSLIRYNNHVYTRVDNNCDDISCTIIPDGGWLWDTVVSNSSVFSSNIIPTIIYPVISSTHIGGEKYGIK